MGFSELRTELIVASNREFNLPCPWVPLQRNTTVASFAFPLWWCAGQHLWWNHRSPEGERRHPGLTKHLPWGSVPFGDKSPSDRSTCRFASPTPSALRVSHSLSGLVPLGPSGLISCRSHP